MVQFYLLPSPPGTTPGISVLDVLFPTPGHTERDNSPPPGLMTWTKNKLLRFDDLFLYLNKTRNLKNHKLLEQLTPFRSKVNIIKLDTHTNTPGGHFNQTASKIEMYLYKTTLKFLEQCGITSFVLSVQINCFSTRRSKCLTQYMYNTLKKLCLKQA